MKMVKKVLLGLAAAATIMAFFGCKMEDDPEGAITGKNNDYSVYYDNTSGEVYRAYESTSLKHAGALVKVKFDKKDVGSSKMGVIFNLQKNAEDKNAKDFLIIGLGTTADRNLYVSKFTNVTKLREDNFGTKLTDNPAVETEYVKLGAKKLQSVPVAADGSVSYYVYFKAQIDGSYDWAVLNLTDEQAELVDMDTMSYADIPAGAELASGNIPDAFDPVDKESDIVQKQLAVYAMIWGNSTLSGSWHYYGMYKEAEEIEE